MFYFCTKFKKSKMKKVILFLSVIVLSIVSCSTNEDPIVNPDPVIINPDPVIPASFILPKKYVKTIESAGLPTETETTFVSYLNNKVVEITYSENVTKKRVYTYNGNLIVKIENFNGSVLESFNEFVYENDKLKTEFITRNRIDPTTNLPLIEKSKEVCTHSANTILVEYFKFINNNYVTSNRSVLYTYLNNNLMKSVENSSYTNTGGIGGNQTIISTNSYTKTYEYDNKINPTLNILGLNKIFFDDEVNVNNVSKETTVTESTLNGQPNTTQSPVVRNYISLYNSNNYLSETKYNYDYVSYNGTTTSTIVKTVTAKYFYE